METRTVEQTKVYFLVLNNMFCDKIEYNETVLISYNKDRLIDFYNSQLLDEPYRDDNGMYRTFKEGQLHDYNRVSDISEQDPFGNGIHSTWVNTDELYKLEELYDNIN